MTFLKITNFVDIEDIKESFNLFILLNWEYFRLFHIILHQPDPVFLHHKASARPKLEWQWGPRYPLAVPAAWGLSQSC